MHIGRVRACRWRARRRFSRRPARSWAMIVAGQWRHGRHAQRSGRGAAYCGRAVGGARAQSRHRRGAGDAHRQIGDRHRRLSGARACRGRAGRRRTRLGELAGERLMLATISCALGGLDRGCASAYGRHSARRGSRSSVDRPARSRGRADPQGGAGARRSGPGRCALSPPAAAAFLPFGRSRACRRLHRFRPGRHLPAERLRLSPRRLPARSARAGAAHARRIGGRTPDPRVRLTRSTNDSRCERRSSRGRRSRRRARLSPARAALFDRADGSRIALAADAPGGRAWSTAMPGHRCGGTPPPRRLWHRPAAGFVPEGRLGGEASFKGKANGLWLWQNDVGQMIVDQLLGQAVSLAA
jgi:hypothetical protein